jgi:2-polyprenyl-3-methyl-5-hydroxy-6-metoxy-1,4-benzoquinol methylase
MDFIHGKVMSDEFIINKLSWDSDNAIKKATRKLVKIADIKINKCNICGETKSSKECSFYGINYLRCKKCSLVYSDKRWSPDKISLFYSNKGKYISDKAYSDKKLRKIREKLNKPKIRFIKKYAKGKHWLDVGSADGSALLLIKKEGFTPTGIEINEQSRKFAKKYWNLDLYPKPLKNFFKENNKKFDVISFFGVLDLVPNPMEEIKIASKLLNKNGLIALSVPNFNSVSTYVQKLIKETDRHLIPETIFYLYTLKSLKFALQKAGFKPLSVWNFGMDSIEFMRYLRQNNKKFENSELDFVLRNNLNQIQRIFDDNLMGDQIFMIGKKK